MSNQFTCAECGSHSSLVRFVDEVKIEHCALCKRLNRDLDYSKLSSLDIEAKGDDDIVKRKGFDFRMQRIEQSLKDAKSDAEHQRFSDIKKQTLGYYNKYHGTNLTS